MRFGLNNRGMSERSYGRSVNIDSPHPTTSDRKVCARSLDVTSVIAQGDENPATEQTKLTTVHIAML
jgi:hypothetical protein